MILKPQSESGHEGNDQVTVTYRYTDVATGQTLTTEEVIARSGQFRDFDGHQLTGSRISAYMLSLVGIKRDIIAQPDGTPTLIENT